MSGVFERTEALVRKGKTLGADEVIANTSIGKRTQIRFSNNEIDISNAWYDYVTTVALSWEKRVVATEIQNFERAEERVEDLFKLAKVSRPNPMYGGIASGSFKYAKSQADERLKDLEDPAKLVYSAIEAAREEAGGDIESGGTLYTRYEDVYFASSQGPTGHDARSSIELSIRVFSQREASGHGVVCSSTLEGFDPEEAGRKAGEIARLARNSVQGEEGKYDVVFDPLFTGSLMGIYGDMASAFNVMIQMSIFANRLGERMAPDTVTIRDSPAAYSVANRVFDDEGVPCHQTVVIDHGILKTYLHNTSTAKIFNTQTTSNAGLIVPQAWNLEVDPGDFKREDLFSEVRNGLYLTNTWYTRFQNFATGDFSTIPRDGAFLIKDGEITKSLKNIRVSDNAARMLSSIKAISRERRHIRWWEAELPSLSPYLLIEGVNITRPR